MAADPVRLAIAARLEASTALKAIVGANGFWFQVAGQKASYPLVVFFRQSPSRPSRVGGLGTVENEVWTVKGVSVKSATQADEIAAAIDAALDGHALSITGRDTISLLREGDVEFPEVDGDTIYRHRGAMYRLRSE